jgi:hypothetical protein
MRFAMGRGFESSQIYAVLKELGIWLLNKNHIAT